MVEASRVRDVHGGFAIALRNGTFLAIWALGRSFLAVPSLVLAPPAQILEGEAWGLAERESVLLRPCLVPRSWRRFAVSAVDVQGQPAIPEQ